MSCVGLGTTYSTESGLYVDTDCGCRRQAMPSLKFCFPLFSPQKRVPHLAFSGFGCSGFVSAVIGFCHRLTATKGLNLPDLANSLRYMCSVQQ